MILAADERDIDLGGEFPLKVLRKCHAAEPAMRRHVIAAFPGLRRASLTTG
jgi:hypothetical protein